MAATDLALRLCALVVGDRPPAPVPLVQGVVEKTKRSKKIASPDADAIDRSPRRARSAPAEAASPHAIGRSQNAKKKRVGAKEDAARRVLVSEAFDRSVRNLAVPASWAVRWDRESHEASLRKMLDKKLAESGLEVRKMSESDQHQLITPIAQGWAAPFEDWLTLKQITAGVAPPIILALFSQYAPTMAVLVSLWIGDVIGPMRFPFVYRIQALVKKWTCADASNQQQAELAKHTPLQADWSANVTRQMKMFSDKDRDGTNIQKDALIWWKVLATVPEMDDEAAIETVALTVLLHRHLFPHVELDPYMLRILRNVLGKRLANEDAYQAMRAILATEAKATDVGVDELERLLDALLEPSRWRKSDPAG
jgi:hypothetical protein